MPPIDRIRGAAPLWLDDGSGFFYLRLAADYACTPARRALSRPPHVLPLASRARGRARWCSRPAFTTSLKLDRGDNSYLVGRCRDRNLVLAIVAHGVLPRALALPCAARRRARRHAALAKAVRHFRRHPGSRASAAPGCICAAAQRAPRFKVLRLPLDRLDLDAATASWSRRARVWSTTSAARATRCTVTRREGVEKRLYRVSHDEPRPSRRSPLPVTGNVRIANAHALRERRGADARRLDARHAPLPARRERPRARPRVVAGRPIRRAGRYRRARSAASRATTASKCRCRS